MDETYKYLEELGEKEQALQWLVDRTAHIPEDPEASASLQITANQIVVLMVAMVAVFMR